MTFALNRKGKLYHQAKDLYWAIRGRLIGEREFLDRVVPYKETARIISALPISGMDALEISGDRWAKACFREYTTVHYPVYDICIEPLPRSFDIIIAEQVFEHLLWPHRAAKNVYKMLRPGGYFLVATPFLQKVHNFPIDCSRWTETGIKYLLADSGFHLDDIQTWSWGNRFAARANLNPHRFPLYNRFLHRNLKNEPLFPVQVWALAQRRVE